MISNKYAVLKDKICCHAKRNENSNSVFPQKKVFDDVGVGIRDNSWNGFNCSLFAYGQTGSGKSYSIIGKSLSLV